MSVFENKLTLGNNQEKKWLGVCAGLAKYMDVDPTVVRLATVLLSLIGGIVGGLIIYLIAYAVIPQNPENE